MDDAKDPGRKIVPDRLCGKLKYCCRSSSLMKPVLLVFFVLIVMALLVTTGCVQQPSPPVVSPSQSAVQTPVPTPVTSQVISTATTVAPAGMGTPGPVQLLPPSNTLDLQVKANGDTANPMTIIVINGGNGLDIDSQIKIVLTEPDGTVVQQVVAGPFSMGQQVLLPSSSYQNRVEIYVLVPQVGEVKVYDQIVLFQSPIIV
jgi:hypothetical protein